MADPIRILIIEDEAPIRRFLKACLHPWEDGGIRQDGGKREDGGLPKDGGLREASLEPENAEWLEAETGGQGTRLVAQKNPDLVLLDLGLPDQDGLEVLRDLREWTDVPVIVLTARGQEKDKVLALDAGADDYVTKPFSVPELMARIRVALRHAARGKPEFEPTFESGGLKVDFERRLVTLNGEEVRLTPIEYRLVALLARHAGKVLTHRHLLTEIWGASYEDSTHTLRVHMGSIRQKIEADPSHPRYIRTETGVGYRMMVDP